MKGRNNALLKLGYKAVRSRAFRNSDEFFEALTVTLTEMGGVYAKFLQGVLLGYAVHRGKNVLQGQFDVYEDNPDPCLSPSVLMELLGPAKERVRIDDFTPIGVGSYSAVYSGILDGSHAVVVKVLRPNIHNEIKFDLKFLRKLTYVIKFAGVKIIAVDITQFYSSFKKACLKETDFRSEIVFANEMYERYKSHKTIVVPRTYLDLSDDRVIIQDKIGGVSAKTLVETKVKDGEDIFALTKNYYNTDLVATMRILSYEMFYCFLSGKCFHGDLHPGNVRILPENQVALLDFGIKAEPYKDSVVPAAVNKLMSDAKFLDGDFDLVRILDAHFRLYMSSLYASIESLLRLQKVEMKEFFKGLVESMGLSADAVSPEKRAEWANVGPASMLNDMLAGGSERHGIEVTIKDQSTQRAITTLYSLLKALGMRGEYGLKPVYDELCPRITLERPQLFEDKKLLLPDIALENIFGWIERLDSTNPVLARKVRALIDSVAKQVSTTTVVS